MAEQAEQPAVPRYFGEAQAAVAEYYGYLPEDRQRVLAWGIAQDYESAVLNRRTVASVADYVADRARNEDPDD
jgi:hypothetical protein